MPQPITSDIPKEGPQELPFLEFKKRNPLLWYPIEVGDHPGSVFRSKLSQEMPMARLTGGSLLAVVLWLLLLLRLLNRTSK